MAKKTGISLTCPIRGAFISYREEDLYVIECLKYLINEKKLDENCMVVNKTLARIGAGGKNSLVPDIMLLSNPPANGEEINPEEVLITVEVKVSPSQKMTALKHQLFPAMRLCKNIEYGIYWDKISRECYDSETHRINISGLYNENPITIDDLMPIKHGGEIWDSIENLMRVSRGTGKMTQKNAANFVKMVVAKFYDEKFNKQIKMYKQRGESPQKLKERVREVYDRAREYYRFAPRLQNYLGGEIKLSDKEMQKCVEIIQDYTLSATDITIIQDFYMKFAPKFLKKDLDQFYTPKELVSLMVNDAKLTSTTKAIDPCGGTGDMMVNIYHRMRQEGSGEAHVNVYCWDLDEDVIPLAQLNMILVGDGRSNIQLKDSLKRYEDNNDEFDLVITNPPFGDSNMLGGREADKYENSKKQVGKLFIERDLNLLKEGGLLITVIPTGYFNNPDDEELRRIISKKARIVALVKLPGGIFSTSGTGVETSILYLQKWRDKDTNRENYNIFVDWVENVGYKAGSKKYKPEYKREKATGVYITDSSNNKIQNNELIGVSRRLRSFAKHENLDCVIHAENSESYDFINFQDINNDGFRLSPMLHTSEENGYKKTVNSVKHVGGFNLKEIGAGITQNKYNPFRVDQIYNYLRTGNIKKDQILELEKLRGWELPDRAKIEDIKHQDIIVAAMHNSENSFGYIYRCYPKLLVSNGFYRIRIEQESLRLCFYKFLMSNSYKNQIRALPTGSIMPTVKQKDLEELLYIPRLKQAEIDEVKNMLENREIYLKQYSI